jgi:phosphohistidine phosphatase
MRRLIILRHAKAERASPNGRDFDRELAPRGREDAAAIGAYMARHGLVPDRAAVSPAARTRETWTFVANGLSASPAVKFDERLFNATPETILQVIRETPTPAHMLCVVAHNPGVQQLALLLAGSGDGEARTMIAEKLPTCGLVVIDVAVDVWSELQAGRGRLDRFVTPRLLRTAI